MPIGHLLLGQLKGRGLSVATSRFATQLIHALEEVHQAMLAAGAVATIKARRERCRL